MISIENLSKNYGSKKVLQNINCSFEKGKVYGIVGKNGAGKTTLFRCMAGLELYDGNITSNYSDFKNHLGLLPTNPYFFSKITGREYLRLLIMSRNVDEKNLDEKNIFNLPLDQYAIQYSTGMKKKLALTGILLQRNNFFIFDEPFNGVDIQSNMVISKIIHKLKALGKTILICSHIFSTLRETCDEIWLLDKGAFFKKVSKNEFSNLESEMLNYTVGKSVEKLNLS